MKKIRVWILSSFLLCGLIVNCSEPIYAANHKSKIESNKNKKKKEKKYTYDDLQKLFISITDKTTKDEVNQYIADNGLSHTEEEYNGSNGGKELNYQIAYTDGAALQKYADPGDYLEISFDESNDTLQYAQYVMEGSVYTALYYNYGTWYDFRESTPGKYTGHYNIDPLGDDDGIEITYDNGNKTKTKYHLRKSSKKAINYVLKNKDK